MEHAQEFFVRDVALAAKDASRVVALASEDTRNAALCAMACNLRAHADEIVEANAVDMSMAYSNNMSQGLIDRLMLNRDRVYAMADALKDLAALPDPLGRVLQQRTLDGGMNLKRVSVPLGVVAMVYEARPNVTADAAGICIKTGNACVLRGGSSALHSNMALVRVLREALVSGGLPESTIELIATTDRGATDELMSLHGIIDVLIPRGGAGLIRHCVEHSRVPVIETGTGNCHTYVHETADIDMAQAIIMNAKTQRVGVCNACESVLIDASIVDKAVPSIVDALCAAGVVIHADDTVRTALEKAGINYPDQVLEATQEDWGREYLSLELSMKTVSGFTEAIEHINTYGTGHSECIVADATSADGAYAIESFYAGVDASAVYANASTRFTDGGCFGLGAEIGISTQKLHARGPFALEALTSYKYLIAGTGQVRG